MKLLNRFYQVSAATLTHRYDASAYLLDTDAGLYLIDCGTPEGYQACLENIGSLGFRPESITAIIGTHGHYDHLGAAALFREAYGTPLYLHRLDREQVESGDPVRTTAGLLYGTEFSPITVERELGDGEQMELGNMRLEFLHTPGHSPGSVSVIIHTSGLKVLIAGDALYGGFSTRIGSDEDAWRKSLHYIASREYDLMSFGHSSPVLLADVGSRINSAIKSFANYYIPWFKDFYREYTY